MSDETSALLRSLDNQRRHALRIVEGLADDDLRRPVLPTGWTCLSLVQHLALDIEEFWFWNVAAGQTTPPGSRVADAWQVAADVPVGEVLDRYRQETERATGIIKATPLDAPPRWWPEGVFGTWRLEDLRQIVLHVITETACHAGHLDAARELIDGRTWSVVSK